MWLGRIVNGLGLSLRCSCTLSSINHSSKHCYRAVSTSCKLFETNKFVESIVNPFCLIRVESFQCNINIKPTDPDKYKNSDRLITQTGNNGHDPTINIDLKMSCKDSVILKIENNRNDGIVGDCLLQVPVQSGIELLCHGNSNAKLQDMQGEKVFVSCEQGNVDTKNIRGSQIELHTDGGNINCTGVLQGNTKLRTMKKGTISCQRLLGRSVYITTEAGDVKLASCYSDESHVTTQSGNIRLENLHRKSTISVKGHGNLFVSGLDGCIEATLEKGSADVQLSKLQGESSINSVSGDVKLRVTDSTNCRLRLKGEKINVPNDFSNNEQDYSSLVIGSDTKVHNLKVTCPNGTIELIKASWISTLNLGSKK